MATEADYQVFHAYAFGACGAITSIARSIITPGLSGGLELGDIEAFDEQGLKDGLLFDALLQLERLEQKADNLVNVVNIDPVREISEPES
jgi:hypothetical protein